MRRGFGLLRESDCSGDELALSNLTDADPTYVDVLNVGCAILPENEEQTDTLEQALRRLPGVSRTCPSAVRG